MKTRPALFCLSMLACASPKATPDTAAPEPLRPKALLIGIDGLKAGGIPGAETPNMDMLMAEGAWSLRASTQLQAPTVSGPGWTSMLTGVDSDKHRIVENGGYADINRLYPTFIGRAHGFGLSTATAIHWLPIQVSLIEPTVTDEIVFGLDETVADGMTEFIAEADYQVLFAALDDVDHAGHRGGFVLENPDYVDAIEVADEQVGRMLTAIAERSTRDEESWLVAITADHGGDSSGHGALNEDCRTIPLLLWGDEVVPGEIQGDFISQMDAHPTIMAHMGHPAEDSWDLDGTARGLEIE